MLQKRVHRSKKEVAVHQAKWKTLLDTMYLDASTHNLKWEDDAYMHTSCNTLGVS
jgi:hypothetical protein